MCKNEEQESACTPTAEKSCGFIRRTIKSLASIVDEAPDWTKALLVVVISANIIIEVLILCLEAVVYLLEVHQ